MTQSHHILAATDLSENATHAVDRGAIIAKMLQARYTVIHAVELDPVSAFWEMLGDDKEKIKGNVRHDAMSALEEMLSDSTHAVGVETHLELVDGLPVAEISSYASAQDVDLILLGAHGSGFLREGSIGATASKLLRKSRCPVLIVKQKPVETYSRVLVAVDFSPASRTAILLARELAPESKLVLTHIIDVPFEGMMRYAGVGDETISRYRISAFERASKRMHDLAASCGLPSHCYTERVVQGNARTHVLSYAEKTGCDLIVMGKHGMHVTEELLLGSVTKHVINESECDVLVVTDKRPPDYV